MQMKRTTKYLFIAILTTASLLGASCGAKATLEPGVQTAVAQTVIAKNAEQNASPTAPAPPAPTQTQLQFLPTLTPLAPLASPTSALNIKTSECAKASLVSETIVDGTIFKPGEKFTKTWEIKNVSACVWDTSYKIIFWNGDALGGAYAYNLPQTIPPQATAPISLLLTAPTADATYKSEWALQTPNGINFGVGEYSAPFYAQIVVSSASKPNYAVTDVKYKMARDPATGCPANVNYTAYATITTNGPLKFIYYWNQSDGHTVRNQELIKMTAAGTTVISNSWKLHIATTPGARWMALVVGVLGTDGESYAYTEYPRVEFTKVCGS